MSACLSLLNTSHWTHSGGVRSPDSQCWTVRTLRLGAILVAAWDWERPARAATSFKAHSDFGFMLIRDYSQPECSCRPRGQKPARIIQCRISAAIITLSVSRLAVWQLHYFCDYELSQNVSMRLFVNFRKQSRQRHGAPHRGRFGSNQISQFAFSLPTPIAERTESV